MNEKIVICDREETFVSLLARQLKKNFEPKELGVFAFDDVEKMMAERDTVRGSVVVIGEELLSAFQTEELIEEAIRIIYLTGEKKKDGIFRYQPASALAARIMEQILQEELFRFDGREEIRDFGKTEIIGIYSPARSIQQSLLALTLGQILAADKKVLYLNFEPCSGMEYLINKTFSHDLTDLLFFIKNNEERFLWRLKSMVEHLGKLDYIPPVFSYPDLVETEPENLLGLVERIAKETDYEAVILDLCDGRGIFSLLRHCDRIFCPYQDNGLAQAKVDQFDRMLGFLKEEKIGSATQFVRLPEFEVSPWESRLLRDSDLAGFIKKEMLKADGS